jgi:hypothetical protein
MLEKCLGCNSEVEFYYDLCVECFEKMPMEAWDSFFEKTSIDNKDLI